MTVVVAMPAETMMAMLLAVEICGSAGGKVGIVCTTKWFNGESCANVNSVGSSCSIVATMSDDSGGGGNSSCGGCG